MQIRSFALLLISAVTVLALTQEASPLQTLIQAERDFAKDSVARNTRDAFIAAFAPDGIGFQPHPTKVKEEFEKRPAQPGPRRGVLNWSPLVAEVAQSGEIGYTTGPFVQENLQTKEKSHGLYSSVWKKQSDGTWKVVLDIGVPVPSAVAPLDATVITPITKSGALKYETAWPALQQAEQSFIQLASGQTLAAAYQRYAADRMRLHRPGVMPFTTRAAAITWAGKQTAKLATLKIEAARSGDFGYSYGSYESGEGKGYYAHYWRCLDKAQWQLVLEVLNPLPK
ncbi:MAG: nuclear transport factor 2 family protein [Blastocatellia bacterium]